MRRHNSQARSIRAASADFKKKIGSAAHGSECSSCNRKARVRAPELSQAEKAHKNIALVYAAMGMPYVYNHRPS